MKHYNNLSDLETHKLREYKSWAKSDAPMLYKLAMLEQLYKVLIDMEIQHLI